MILQEVGLLGDINESKSEYKKRGPNDQIVRRKGKLYVINKRNPRHKQRQG